MRARIKGRRKERGILVPVLRVDRVSGASSSSLLLSSSYKSSESLSAEAACIVWLDIETIKEKGLN